ncbi:uncharacterized, partial [Tachysurus ichikawai]
MAVSPDHAALEDLGSGAEGPGAVVDLYYGSQKNMGHEALVEQMTKAAQKGPLTTSRVASWQTGNSATTSRVASWQTGNSAMTSGIASWQTGNSGSASCVEVALSLS